MGKNRQFPSFFFGPVEAMLLSVKQVSCPFPQRATCQEAIFFGVGGVSGRLLATDFVDLNGFKWVLDQGSRSLRGQERKTMAEQEMLLVGSKAKAALKEHDVNVGGDALDGLNSVIHNYIEQAAKRATENGRKTVRAHDFTC